MFKHKHQETTVTSLFFGVELVSVVNKLILLSNFVILFTDYGRCFCFVTPSFVYIRVDI